MNDQTDVERLWLMLESGNLEGIRAAVRTTFDVNTNIHGKTLLTHAVSRGFGQAGVLLRVRALLALGARPSAESADLPLGTSLHRAASNGYLDVLRELLASDSKSAIDRFDDSGRTPLICAIEGGHAAEAVAILEAGADVNAHDPRSFSDTALSVAVQQHAAHLVEILMAHGGDSTIVGWMQMTAADHAQDWRLADGCSEKDLRAIDAVLERAQ